MATLVGEVKDAVVVKSQAGAAVFEDFVTDAIDTVKDKANAKADLVKESLEKSKVFAGNVLNSTATLASQKLEKGTEFASSVNQKVHQVIADKASLAGDAKDAVVAKSKAGAEAFGGFVADTIDAVNDKAGHAADVVKELFEKTKTFAGEVLNSTANLASQKVEEGKEL